MKTAGRPLTLIASLGAMLLLGACATSSVYESETFNKNSPYQKNLQQGDRQACEAAQLALMGQGYRIEKAEDRNVHARKDFQPEDEVNVTIDFEVTCKARENGSTVFVNAVQTTYKLKKTASATSLSVPGAGSIAMPWSKGTDSLVKVASETVADEKFYKRFFDLLPSYLGK